MDPTSKYHQNLIDAFNGFYKIEVEKDSEKIYIPLRDWFKPLKSKTTKTFKTKNPKSYFLNDIISKLDLIKLLIFYWPYRPRIHNFDLRIQPWLEL
jgi:hypothetical protein